jgi:hypothetical protein
MKSASLGRRRLLKALAAGAVTLPFLRKVLAKPDGQAPKRLFIFMQNNGTQQKNFWPDASLSSPILDSLFLDPGTGRDNGLRGKTNLVKGVYVPSDANGTNGNTHDMGFARMFTGAPLVSYGGQPWGGAASVDQLLAQAWGIDTLTMAVLASQTEPHPKPGFDHRESFSYLAPATLKHPRKDPIEVWRYLFPPTDPAAPHRVSVLDAVAANLAELSSQLGPKERAKLDLHLTAIRDVERRLAGEIPQCGAPPAPTDYLALDPYAELNEDTYIPQMVDDLVDLGVLALSCGITRIASLQFGYGGGKWRFAWEGIDVNCHDDVAHLDVGDAGSTPENTQRVVRMNRYYASRVARLATALDAIPEGSGTMLDNTLVVWANEQGRGDHGQENVPIVFIGGAGGAIARGGRVVDRGRQVMNRLGCTILNVMGTSAAGFGDAPDCGVFDGLL